MPLAQEFNALPEVEYIFVATTPFDTQRAEMGYIDENKRYDFIIRPYENQKQNYIAHQLAIDADIVIVGSAPDSYMAERLNSGKITFHTSERYFKKGLSIKTFPRYFASAMKHIRPYQNKQLYYLCASAYTAYDINTFACFQERCFKWGYFTEVHELDDSILMKKREGKDKPIILWAGRFLELKHPDVVVRLADRLKREGYYFQMQIIGGGEMEEKLKEAVNSLDLNDEINFLGFLPPEMVRKHMESADIFLFTSDFNEGWGAVLSEAMSSGCAVVSSHAAGAAPYLIEDGKNGFLYENGNEEDLYSKVTQLLNNQNCRIKMGKTAYRDMREIWSPKEAASRLLLLSEAINSGKARSLFTSGPCSPAEILKNDWYKSLR